MIIGDVVLWIAKEFLPYVEYLFWTSSWLNPEISEPNFSKTSESFLSLISSIDMIYPPLFEKD